MRDIEVEEGEAYLFRDGDGGDDDDDDDENIDPDRDFSYIDRKLEKLLGHYQKDFMLGFSADSQGPIFGGYGSFLPVYERSPPILSNHRSQSQVCSKSPSNLQSKHFSQTPSVPANTSLPARTAPVPSNQSVRFLSKSEVPTVNNQLTVENSAKCASNHHVEPKNPPLNHSGPKLKFRVKMAPESVLHRDNSSIYSGLGLDMSPSSSPEGTPLEKDGTLLGLQETNLESPSFIVKIMTSTAVPNEALISPLHDDLISLMEVENTLETHLPRSGQVEPLDIVHDSFYLDGRKGSVEKEQKLKDMSKENNSKQKEASKEMKSKQDTKRQKPFELVKEDNKEDGNVIKIRRKSEKDKNLIPSPKDKPGTKKRNESGLGEDEANKVLKQHSVVKNEVKEEDLVSVYPKKAYGYRKESGKHEIIANNKKVAVVYEKDVKDNNTHYGIPQVIKHDEVVSSNPESYAKAIPPLQNDLILEEPPSSVAKKDFRTGSLSSTQPPRGSAVSSSRAEYEEVISKNNPSRSKRGDVVLTKQIKDKVAVIENTSKKEKEVSLRGVAMGATEREGQQSASKMKVQLNSKKVGAAAIPGPNSGDVINLNGFKERVPGDELPPPENASLVPLEMDDWVQCEKCQKWRLLPFGTNPDSLPKEWICRMLTWLPGMNKCSVSEDETTHALRARYLPTVLGPSALVLNDQQAHLDGTACVKALSGAQNVGLANLSPSAVMLSRCKKHSLSKLEIHAARQSGGGNFSRAMKRDLQHAGGTGSLKDLKKKPSETACASKNAAAAGRPSKIPKKRMAEAEVYEVPKKIKKGHQQSSVNSGDAGLILPEIKGQSQNYNPDAFQISWDFVPGSSECPPVKLKNKGQSAMQAMNGEVNVVSEKKRKLKDQCQNAIASEPFCNGQRPQDINIKGNNVDKGHRRMKDDGCKHNLGCADDISTSQELGIGPHNVEPHHSDRMSRKISDARKSEKAGDLGLSDNATTSSSSKVSIKVKMKAREVKCSPVGSISSSPFKVCKSDPEKGMDKIGVLYNEPVELSSIKRFKSKAEGPCASNEFAPRNEVVKDRKKSNLSRIAGVKPDAVHVDQYSKKASSGKPSNANRLGALPKLEDFEGHDGKLDHRHHEEGTVPSQKNPENRRVNGLNFDGTELDRQKLQTADMSDEKGSSSYSRLVPELENGSRSNSVRVDHGNRNLSGHVLDNRVNLRHPHLNTHAFKDMEDSTSMKKDSFQWAVTALKEAKDLKHSANRLKTTGSGFSTGLFLQAALKFLHGASLLEPGDNENGRHKEMSSTEVYSSTAKLFEYCAHEFEKCDDMASATLAYKCMEVAYMRVVYNNDVAASRDRIELQMAVRAAPHVESPSSSASDIDNLNNHMAIDLARNGHSAVDHRTHVISAGSRPNFVRLISFTHDINLAMEASRKSQNAFAVANSRLSQSGNEEAISSIKRVLDFSFHDVDGLLHLVRLAMVALEN